LNIPGKGFGATQQARMKGKSVRGKNAGKARNKQRASKRAQVEQTGC